MSPNFPPRLARDGRLLPSKTSLVFGQPLVFASVVVVIDDLRNVSESDINFIDALELVKRPVVFAEQEEFCSLFVSSAKSCFVAGRHVLLASPAGRGIAGAFRVRQQPRDCFDSRPGRGLCFSHLLSSSSRFVTQSIHV